MKASHLLVVVLGVCAVRIGAEPVAELKDELNAKRKVVNDWFKGELVKIARQARTDEERSKVLTACDWEWDAGDAGVTKITLKEDGSGTHHYQGSSFAWSHKGWEVKIVNSRGDTANLRFDPNTLKYSGKDFDGKRTIKGSPQLTP
jgi:hypothetical protein